MSKVLRKKKVPVTVIIQSKHFKILDRSSAFGHHRFGLGFLFRKYSSDGCFSKLQFGFNPEQTLGAFNQGTVQGHTHVTNLYFLDNVVFRRRIFQLDQVLKSKGRLGVVIDIDIQSSSHFSHQTHAYSLVKIKRSGRSVSGRKCGIVLFCIAQSEVHFYGTRWFHVDGVAAKNGFEKSRFHVIPWQQIFFCRVATVFIPVDGIQFLLEIVAHRFFSDQIFVFLWR